ncbi:MAG TPA: hypothetical protein PLQ20_02770, partial [Candidatus Paceibacterota bacterium]|nr:hypothetical protein [Candidatus Paceibacterota bacterium]
MQYIQTIKDLFLEIKGFLDEQRLENDKITTLGKALVLVGGKNEAISDKIDSLSREQEAKKDLFLNLQSQVKNIAIEALPAFFEKLNKNASFDNFSLEEDQFLRGRTPRLIFIEGKDTDFVYKKISIELDSIEDHFEKESPTVIYLQKITDHDDGRGGGKESLLFKMLQGGIFQYLHG